MSELRKDPIMERWAVIAPNRAARPQAFDQNVRVQATDAYCPFCEGHEHETPGEVMAVRRAGSQHDQPGWSVRVVPNKFPALQWESNPDSQPTQLFNALPALGRHEVIIEAPHHVLTTGDLDEEGMALVLQMYVERLRILSKDPRVVAGLVFKNVGAAAGASIEHTHSQLVALPMTPPVLAQELAGAERHFERTKRCAFCEMIDHELADGRRVVEDFDDYVAFCPFASCCAYETWILPKRHESHFEKITSEERASLGRVLRHVMLKIETVLDRAAYNYVIHSAPFDTISIGHYHWHIEIIPRLTKTAGFEWGSGCFINPVAPEEAAASLRNCEIFSAEPVKTPNKSFR
jgi:UDPglucose--hexose-1-phosphate uridylyltransferase